MQTQIFQTGDFLAVRIPPELNFGTVLQEVEIEREGDSLIIRPTTRRNLIKALDAFAAFPPNFMVEGREFHEQKERDWK